MASTMRIGVISDTHGLLRPEVIERLAGVHYVIHAGDVGRPEVISELRKIAPITAIRETPIEVSGPLSTRTLHS